MEVEVKIDQNSLTPKIVIYTNEVTDEIQELIKKLTNYNQHSLIGYQNGEIIIIQLEDVYRIYSQEQKVVVQTKKETAYLKNRIYN